MCVDLTIYIVREFGDVELFESEGLPLGIGPKLISALMDQ